MDYVQFMYNAKKLVIVIENRIKIDNDNSSCLNAENILLYKC